MIPPAWPIKSHERIPPANDPARPRPIVAKIPIGSGPGSASRASAPTIRPSRASTRMNHRTRTPDSGPQALEEARPRSRVLVVVEDARVVEVLAPAAEATGALGRSVARTSAGGGA